MSNSRFYFFTSKWWWAAYILNNETCAVDLELLKCIMNLSFIYRIKRLFDHRERHRWKSSIHETVGYKVANVIRTSLPCHSSCSTSAVTASSNVDLGVVAEGAVERWNSHPSLGVERGYWGSQGSALGRRQSALCTKTAAKAMLKPRKVVVVRHSVSVMLNQSTDMFKPLRALSNETLTPANPEESQALVQALQGLLVHRVMLCWISVNF